MRHATPSAGGPAEPPVGALGAPEAQIGERAGRALSTAVSLHLEGNLEKAAKVLKNAIEGGAREPALYSALGRVQYEMHDYEAAATSYAHVAAMQPMHQTAHFNLAVCLGNLSRWEPAGQSFQRAFDLDRNSSEAMLGLGVCLLHLERSEEALAAFNRYLVRHNESEQALFGKAVALQQASRLLEAAEFYGLVLQRNPRSADALSNRLALSLAANDLEATRRDAGTLLEIGRAHV